MASIAWHDGFPVKVITQSGTGLAGQCDYTIGDGQTWIKADFIAGAYDKLMQRDQPKAGQCWMEILGLPPGNYDCTASLYDRLSDGSTQILSTPPVRVTV